MNKLSVRKKYDDFIHKLSLNKKLVRVYTNESIDKLVVCTDIHFKHTLVIKYDYVNNIRHEETRISFFSAVTKQEGFESFFDLLSNEERILLIFDLDILRGD